MHSSAILIKAMAAVVCISTAVAFPLQVRDDNNDLVSGDDQPLIQLQIHPNNRTDRCLGLISPGPVENSTLGVTACNYTSPNTESEFYSFWTVSSEGDDEEENPALGFELRLNGTQLCLDTSNGISDSPATLGRCRDSAASQQWLYSDDRQINVPQTFTCLGLGTDNVPQVQDCVPEQIEQTWGFEAFPGLKRRPSPPTEGSI